MIDGIAEFGSYCGICNEHAGDDCYWVDGVCLDCKEGRHKGQLDRIEEKLRVTHLDGVAVFDACQRIEKMLRELK